MVLVTEKKIILLHFSLTGFGFLNLCGRILRFKENKLLLIFNPLQYEI